MLNDLKAAVSGFLVGILGGLIGLGGAEFRLPILVGLFAFDALPAVIINKAVSLVVVTFSLPARLGTVSFETILSHWHVIATLLSGSLFGAWFGAGWATRLRSETLFRVLSVLLVMVAFVLFFSHQYSFSGLNFLSGIYLVLTGAVCGFLIGIFAAVMGVAGGELLIPAIVLLFGTDIKTAGSLSLAVSIPTMLMGFARYSRDKSFTVISQQKRFLLVMAAGSVAGVFAGGKLLGIVSTGFLIPLMCLILLISSVKIWKHGK
ncbi:sulfite exporter TauE/SafE family protein [Seleniivibrio woodruffii]|uniref:Probable membrane transporter protein n=2 Tax=Seleniivibrio woodruffii TaxID=1078050 RepID=A0A4R1K908_9BACT|nr:sulfite exporter TauE/SafE family protein [Seleniivibrio woodruffii]TCK60487.1 putative membrane protein YfcA [Seleniivibrio woodruffii]TVZ36115.1 putative membrane protein YfcA [Seleniivibrio woodruffii]